MNALKQSCKNNWNIIAVTFLLAVCTAVLTGIMEHNAFPDSFDLLEFAGKLFNKHPISESEPDKPHLTLVVPKEDEDV